MTFELQIKYGDEWQTIAAYNDLAEAKQALAVARIWARQVTEVRLYCDTPPS